jgi:anaerobic ribonucleoside-triphosphate reductase
MTIPLETTDITLFVRTSGEDIVRWNRQRIVEALIRETGVDVDTAETISRDVEKQIVSSGISLLTTPLIRELVDAKLIERGLEHDRRMHALLGFPLYDVRQLIFLQNKESANVPHGPEGTNLVLAEGIKREYALYDVFSREVGDAHIMGDIHIHALGYIDRVYNSHQSPEYIKKYGLNLPHSMTVAKPARQAEVVLAHLVRFGAMLQGHCAGIIGWQAINYFFAPYLVGKRDQDIRQFAQMLIYEFSQLTSARGGQAMFTDIHLHWDVPGYLENVPAIGPGGEQTGQTYGHYRSEAQRFAWSLFEIFKEGDATGKPFIFPRPLIHLTERFFKTPGHEAFLNHLCQVAIEKGNPCFIFDREEAGKSLPGGQADNQKDYDGKDSESPWKMRQSAIQNITLNLPRLGYKAKGDDRRLFLLLSELMELAVQGHVQKKDFMEKLLSYGDQGPLSMLTMNGDGSPYLRMAHAIYLVGMVGLNELVCIHRGQEMHDSEDALAFGLQVVEHMKTEADRLSAEYGLKFVLEQTPAETTAYRFARLDLKYYSPEAGHYIRGNLIKGEIYYTNSTHLSGSAPVLAFDRAAREGRFHPFIGSNAVTHLWLGDHRPTVEKLADFIIRVFHETRNHQIILSPEFTSCSACGTTSDGLYGNCPSCGSPSVEGIARITQYFSRIAGWNKGKLAELKDRNRQASFFS